jgi:c(7)-type cytochrome triheme protein
MVVSLLLTMAGGAVAFELKDVKYRTENAGNVVFSHNDHLKQKKIRNNCKSCHKESSNKIPKATMAQMEKGASCGACHNGKKAFTLSNCVGCHKVKQVALQAGDFGGITFSHRDHATKQRCENCHTKVYRTGKNPPVGMAAMKSGKSCGACHNGKSAFGLDKCAKCHPFKQPVYRIAGAGDVKFNHGFHLDLYSCRDCHPGTFSAKGKRVTASMGDMAAGKSCGACHDGKTAFTSQENCARCHTL